MKIKIKDFTGKEEVAYQQKHLTSLIHSEIVGTPCTFSPKYSINPKDFFSIFSTVPKFLVFEIFLNALLNT